MKIACRRFLVLTVFPFVLSFILSILNRGFSFVSFINYLFLVSLVQLSIGGGLFIIEGGLFRSLNFQQFRLQITGELIVAGGLLFSLSLAASFIFYM